MTARPGIIRTTCAILLLALTCIFHARDAGSGDPAYRSGFGEHVGRVPSGGAPLAFQLACEIPGPSVGAKTSPEPEPPSGDPGADARLDRFFRQYLEEHFRQQP